MRTYGKHKMTTKTQERVKLYAKRVSTEWDIRIDCDQDYANEIVNKLMCCTNLFEYCMVSGIESPDTVKHGSKENHVHIGLVCNFPMRRDQVLAACRGPTKKTDEYATPRNRKFTYAGWYLHHTKSDCKLPGEQQLRLEYGVLPVDREDTAINKEVSRMYLRFANDCPEKKKKFERYLNFDDVPIKPPVMWKEKQDNYLS